MDQRNDHESPGRGPDDGVIPDYVHDRAQDVLGDIGISSIHSTIIPGSHSKSEATDASDGDHNPGSIVIPIPFGSSSKRVESSAESEKPKRLRVAGRSWRWSTPRLSRPRWFRNSRANATLENSVLDVEANLVASRRERPGFPSLRSRQARVGVAALISLCILIAMLIHRKWSGAVETPIVAETGGESDGLTKRERNNQLETDLATGSASEGSVDEERSLARALDDLPASPPSLPSTAGRQRSASPTALDPAAADPRSATGIQLVAAENSHESIDPPTSQRSVVPATSNAFAAQDSTIGNQESSPVDVIDLPLPASTGTILRPDQLLEQDPTAQTTEMTLPPLAGTSIPGLPFPNASTSTIELPHTIVAEDESSRPGPGDGDLATPGGTDFSVAEFPHDSTQVPTDLAEPAQPQDGGATSLPTGSQPGIIADVESIDLAGSRPESVGNSSTEFAPLLTDTVTGLENDTVGLPDPHQGVPEGSDQQTLVLSPTGEPQPQRPDLQQPTRPVGEAASLDPIGGGGGREPVGSPMREARPSAAQDAGTAAGSMQSESPSMMAGDTSASTIPDLSATPGLEPLPNRGVGALTVDRPLEESRAVETVPLAAARRSENSTDAGASPFASLSHVVQPGENYFTISRLYYGSGRYWQALWTANRQLTPEPTDLTVGSSIQVPPPELLERPLIGSDEASPPGPFAPPSLPPGRDELVRQTREESENVVTLPSSSAAPGRLGTARLVEEPAEPAVPTYTVRGDYETFRTVARDTLGDPKREDEIRRLNQDLAGEQRRLSPGTRLRLPYDAQTTRVR